jgi:ElaB/YqjD/DUF883 family membrane-anchored ribosome-binding protein
MVEFVSNAVDRLTALINSLRLKQILVVALAGFFVFSSTACSSGVDARSTDGSGQKTYSSSPYDKNDGPTRELYKPTQKREGGMNNYNDDLKYDRDDVKAQAEKRVQQAKENLNKSVDSPQELLSNIKNRNPLDDKARESYDSIKDSTEKLTNDFSEGTRKGTRNLQENLDKASDNAPRIFNEAKRNAQGAIDDVREGAESLGIGAGNVVNRAGEAVKNPS